MNTCLNEVKEAPGDNSIVIQSYVERYYSTAYADTSHIWRNLLESMMYRKRKFILTDASYTFFNNHLIPYTDSTLS